MPFFYDVNASVNTNATPSTETAHLLGIAAALQGFKVQALYANSRAGTTVGGGSIRGKTGGTSTAGGATTPSKRHPNSPAAGSTWSTAPTTTGSPVVRVSVGFSQTGGQGGWIALNPDDAIIVLPAVTNKFEVESISISASQGLDIVAEFSEE